MPGVSIRSRDYRFLHCEDYRKPLDVYGCCKRCHADLHARFRDPERWQRVLRKYGRPGLWFTLLSLDPASQWRPFDETYSKGLPWPPASCRTGLRLSRCYGLQAGIWEGPCQARQIDRLRHGLL